MNRGMLIAAAVALAAFVAGVIVYWNDGPANRAAASMTAPAPLNASSQRDVPEAPHRGDSAPPVADDPRLAALQVSPDNGLIKFVTAPDGKVIAEIDQDPASPGYGRPSREYIYMRNAVVSLTAYRYTSDQVEITQTLVAYQPDGRVADIKTSTRYQNNAGQTR